MTAAWPSEVPSAIVISTLAEEMADNIISSSVSVGPAKIRRRTTASIRKMSGTIIMTLDELITFRTFVTTTISDRVRAFTFPDPYGGSDLLVRMTDAPKISPSESFLKVAISLEVLP